MKKIVKVILILMFLFSPFLFVSCFGDDDGGDGEVPCLDNDGDGYGLFCALGWDCDDSNPDVHPGAAEICDEVDNQCWGDEGYGTVDEGCPLYSWTKRMGGTSGDAGYDIEVDNNGNVYVTGNFYDTVNFAEDFGGSDIKTSEGDDDIFITKINSDETYGWTRRIGGITSDIGRGISVDNNGNIYLTGYFSGTVDFGADFGGSDIKTSAGTDDYIDIFVTRINSNGSYGWTRRMGGIWFDFAYGIAVDNNGNIYVTGAFDGPVDFAEDFGGSDLKNYYGAYITRINPDGSYGWTKTVTGDVLGFGVSVDNNGNVYVTGSFWNTVDFAEDFGGSDSKTAEGSRDIFVTRINSDGSYGWTRRMGGSDWDDGLNISVDNDGNVYASGMFGGEVDFASDFGESDIKSSAGKEDIFVTRINSDGSYGWTRRMGGIEWDQSNGIAVDNNGNMYITGRVADEVNFAEDFGGSDFKTSDWYDGFVTQIHSEGSYGWTKRIGDYGVLCFGISVDNNGNVYVTGTFSGPSVDFARDFGGSDIKTSAGYYDDVFVTRIDIIQ